MKTEIFLLILVAIFGFLAFLILRPYLNYIFFAAIITFVSYPLYKKLRSKLKSRILSASILLVCMLLILVIPSLFVTLKLFAQAKEIFVNLQAAQLENFAEKISSLTGVDVRENIVNLSSNIISYTVSNIFKITRAVANIIIGLFILMFTMFYLYVDGEKITAEIKRLIPLSRKYQDHLINRTYNVMQALLLGIFATAFIQGLFGGIGFFLFGISNAVFWGFVMTFFSLIPFLGPHFIYIPASLFLMYKGNMWAGIGLLVYGIIIVSNLDNVIRPKIVRIKARIHPLIVILGVIGGIALMGIVGMVLGPLILALFLELVKVHNMNHDAKKK